MGADGMGGGAGGAGAAGGAGGDFDMYGGIDPSMDPELAMAIRASTEEARAQEEARARAAQEASMAEGGSAATPAAPSSSSASEGEWVCSVMHDVAQIGVYVYLLVAWQW